MMKVTTISVLTDMDGLMKPKLGLFLKVQPKPLVCTVYCLDKHEAHD